MSQQHTISDTRRRWLPACPRCGQPGYHQAHGLCTVCYHREYQGRESHAARHPWAHPATPPGQAEHYRFAVEHPRRPPFSAAPSSPPPAPATEPPPGVPAAWWADLAATFNAAELRDLGAVAAECARVAEEAGL